MLFLFVRRLGVNRRAVIRRACKRLATTHEPLGKVEFRSPTYMSLQPALEFGLPPWGDKDARMQLKKRGVLLTSNRVGLMARPL